jgi:hypothetical protein
VRHRIEGMRCTIGEKGTVGANGIAAHLGCDGSGASSCRRPQTPTPRSVGGSAVVVVGSGLMKAARCNN